MAETENIESITTALHAAALAALQERGEERNFWFGLMVRTPAGAYSWRNWGGNLNEAIGALHRAASVLALSQEEPRHTCAGCGLRGGQMRGPLTDGWTWTAQRQPICQSCQLVLKEPGVTPGMTIEKLRTLLEAMRNDPALQNNLWRELVPALPRHLGLPEDELLELGFRLVGDCWCYPPNEEEDVPDLGQAPTNLGTDQVPLFLDDDPEDAVEPVRSKQEAERQVGELERVLDVPQPTGDGSA